MNNWSSSTSYLLKPCSVGFRNLPLLSFFFFFSPSLSVLFLLKLFLFCGVLVCVQLFVFLESECVSCPGTLKQYASSVLWVRGILGLGLFSLFLVLDSSFTEGLVQILLLARVAVDLLSCSGVGFVMVFSFCFSFCFLKRTEFMESKL